MKIINDTIYKSIKILSSNILFCISILLFMGMVIIGTIIQKEIGLKTVQDTFFNAFFIYYNENIIFPGGKLIITLIFLNLSIKLICEKIKKISTFLIHLGFLCFLFFLFIFLNLNDENYMIIEETETKNYIIDNNNYNIKINYLNTPNDFKFKIKNIQKEQIYKIKNSKNKVKIQLLTNTEVKINNTLKKDFFIFKKIPNFVEKANDKIAFEIKILEKKKLLKKFVLIENIIEQIYDDKYYIDINKSIEILPFYITLLKFNKTNYTKTKSPKSFKSEILITNNNLKWKYDIEMNKPLKYKQYIFYQSSFIDNGDKKSTILYVKHHSKIEYAYFSCLISLLGFLIHISKFSLKLGKKNE